MSILDSFSRAGQNHRTIILTIKEENGLLESREVEPYLYRKKDGDDVFYCYDLYQDTPSVIAAANIIFAEETTKNFNPRYPVMFSKTPCLSINL